MNKKEAILAMLSGEKVRESCMPKGYYIYMTVDFIFMFVANGKERRRDINCGDERGFEIYNDPLSKEEKEIQTLDQAKILLRNGMNSIDSVANFAKWIETTTKWLEDSK